jgi:deoxyribodipyrimidine photo-lyase
VQSAQRARHNEALEYAAQRANEHGVPLLAVFGATGGGAVYKLNALDP